MVETMTADVKMRIADLERQKIDLIAGLHAYLTQATTKRCLN